MKLLCLSNGHGEDAIATRILKSLQNHANPPELAALPIVGAGHAYLDLGIPIIGKVKTMPSGGFINQDSRELWRDLQGGLLSLFWQQIVTIRTWAKQGGAILAVGDIVPLGLAWLSGANYAFVGTAKSEYYLRDEAGLLPRLSWLDDRFEIWSGSVYHPWERWLMHSPRCTAVFPRDTLTAKTLPPPIPVFDLGNPMMDDLEPSVPQPRLYGLAAEQYEQTRSLTITLIPGSRPPEAYNNWQQIIQSLDCIITAFPHRPIRFLGAIAPSLDFSTLEQAAKSQNWQKVNNEELTKAKASLRLSREYNDCLQAGDIAIAMSGTATEQFVGGGKPAIAMIGNGPQYTYRFAEAQSRLLGRSLILVEQAAQVGNVVQSLLRDPDRLKLIAENGIRRLGKPGAAARIADCLLEKLSF